MEAADAGEALASKEVFSYQPLISVLVPVYNVQDRHLVPCIESVLTQTYPAFCIVFRDDIPDPDRLRFPLCHELGHLFMNHYRDYPEQMEPGRVPNSTLEAEADAFARNLLAPVPIVDVIRFNRPRQARGNVFGLTRNAWISRLDTLAADRAYVDEEMANTLIWLFREYLLGRRCTQCGCVFTDENQEDRCPVCGASAPDWNLLPAPAEK